MDTPHENPVDAYWMPFTANRQFKKAPRLLARSEGMHYWTPEGRQILDGVAGLWCVNAGHARPKIVQAIQAAGRRDGLRAAVPDGPSQGLRTGRAPGQADAGRARQGLLHELGLGVGRDRAEDGAGLPPRARRGPAHPPDRARARLPRGQLRRHLGRRHGRQPQDVRLAAGRRRPHPPHPRPGAQRLQRRPAGARRRTRRRPRAPVRAARSEHDRRGDRRAGCRLDRRADAAAGLPAAPARDLRQARHPADLRRGHHRVRPPRRAVRGATLRRHARPDDRGQGHHQRLRADGRGVCQAARSTTPS